MAAYVLVQANVVNDAVFQRYHAVVPDTLKPYDGRYLVRGGRIAHNAGAALPYSRIVLIEFPSVELATAWFRSPEYAAARQVKGASMDGSLTIIEGVD